MELTPAITKRYPWLNCYDTGLPYGVSKTKRLRDLEASRLFQIHCKLFSSIMSTARLFTTSLSALPNQQPSLTVNFKNTISMKNSRSNNPQSHYGKQTNKRKANCLSITCTKTCIHSPAAEETLSSFPSAFQTGVSPTDNATDETPQSVTSFYMQ